MNKRKLVSALVLCSMVVFQTASLAQDVNPDTIGDVSGQSYANGSGGAIFNQINHEATVTKGSTINNNTAGVHGGAIYNEGTVNISDGITDGINITHTTFTKNSSHAGGAISSLNGSKLYIGNYTSFENNETFDQGGDAGGALYVSDSTLTIGNHVNFSENTALSQIDDATQAKGAAGAIYVYNSDVTIGTDLNVSKNQSEYAGGGIYIWNNDGQSEATIGTDANFSENKSNKAYGGAIGNFDGKLTIDEGAKFEGNSASTNGGAIANMNFSSINGANLTLTGAEFTNNKADIGGAIYNDSIANVSNTTFSGNSATTGGALYNASTGTATLTDVSVNTANSNGSNSIYNAGSVTTASTGTNSNTFASTITNAENSKWEFGGTNNVTGVYEGSGTTTNTGTVNLAGNASGYTGDYIQTDPNAVTTVTGTFYGGNSTVSGGTLNWNTTNNTSTGTLAVSGDATNLNIGTAGSDTEPAVQGNLSLGSGSSIASEVNTVINSGSSLTLNGGNAVLNSDDTWDGTVNLINENSTLTIDNIGEYDGIINAQKGTLDFNGGEFTLNKGSQIEEAVNVDIGQDSTYVITEDVPVTIDNNDTWAGTVKLDGGILNVSGRTDDQGNGILDANTGTLNITNNGFLDIGTGSDIAEAITTNITKGSTLNVTDGTVTLNGTNSNYVSDIWNGIVNLTGGTLTVQDGLTNGAINATGGTLDLVNQNFNLATGSQITGDVTTSIDSTSVLNVNGGSATLDSGDDWDGGLTLNGGSLSVDGSVQDTTTSFIQANTGTLNVTGGTVTVGTNNNGISSAIQNEVALNVSNGANIDITKGGIVGVDDNDTLGGTTTLNGGTLNYGMTDPDATNITANTGYLNLLENSVLEIQTPSNIADAVVVDIQKGSTLQTNSGTTFNLNGGNADPSQNDKWSGLIRNWGGTVNATNMVNDSTSALQQYGGTTNIDSNSNIILDNVMSKVTSGVVNVKNNSTLSAIDASILQGGDLNVDSTSKFVSFDNGFNMTNLNHSGSLIGLNNAIEDYTLTSSMNIGTTGDNQGDFTLDVYGRSNGEGYNDADRFFADVIRNASDSESATINISDWNLGGDIFGWDAPIDKHINLGRIFNYNTLEGNVNFTETDKEIFTPIGWYRLNNTGGLGGNYTMDLTRFNPQVYRGQVTTLAQWMNQLAIDDMLFNHSMLLPSFKEEDGGTAYTGMMANRYAATMPQYAPYQYSRKDGGLWVKMYGTFETLQMSQGLNNVGNNAYGTLIGADFGLKELKHGWKFMPTAYIGYNGAHQYYSGLGAYQNGGQAGFLGTWYKNNFIIGGLIYGGVYQNSLDIAGHTDNTFNYFAGAATKAAYNWRFHRDWVLQPNLLLAYNFFGQQNWHSDFGQMGMMSGILNGINLAPGLNLIWEKETFSIYATIQYMYNLNGAVGGRAGNVDLPHLYMDRGYIQYGFGFTKRFTDRFAGYFQTVFRNVGRTGVGFQLGFNFLLGK